MMSYELESCLTQAFQQARSAHCEFVTVEHLLLALLDAPKVREVLKSCGADLDRLGTDLKQHIATDNLLWVPMPGEEHPVQAKPALLRVLQRAVFHSKSRGDAEVGVEEVLKAIFSEQESRAALLLGPEGVTHIGVVNYLQSGAQA